MTPKTIRVLRSNCEDSDNGKFRVHLDEREWGLLCSQFESLEAERNEARAECDKVRKRAWQFEYERDEVRKRLEQQTDWYQQRFNRLRKWVKEEVEPLSKEVAHRYFSICANGSPAPHESADWTDTMHGLKLRAEQAEKQRDEALFKLAEAKSNIRMLRAHLEAITIEFESTVAHADWRAAGSKGMSVPYHGDFASAVQLPSVIVRMRMWAKGFREVLEKTK